MTVGTVKATINKVIPGGVTYAEGDEVVQAAVKGGLTSKTLHTVDAFFESGPLTSNVRKGSEAVVEDIFMGLPRDFSAAGSGQKFSQTVTRHASGIPIGLSGPHPIQEWRSPGKTRIEGNAQKDYTLKFNVARSTLSVPIKKGWTPQQTAQAMAAAVNRAQQRIVDGALQRQYTADRKGSDMVLTGVRASAHAGVLELKITASS